LKLQGTKGARNRTIKLIIVALFLLPHLAHGRETPICPSIIFDDKLPFKFSDDELRLLCGGPAAESEAWEVISPGQAKLSMTAMLQQRGYHMSRFAIDQGILRVSLGQVTVIKHIYIKDAPESLDINRKRGLIGEKLTPNKLDELQNWIGSELKHLGFPCPKVETVANFETGEILATIISGPLQKILKIDADEISDLHPGVIRRFDAFHIDDIFDIWKVEITERRAMNEDFVLGDHFKETCTPQGVELYQVIQPGLPRTLRVGVGLDSEEGPQFTLSTHYNRLNKRGSSLTNTLLASFRIQSFTSNFDWYVLRNSQHFFLKPQLEIKRDVEPSYEYLESQIETLPTYNWDDLSRRWEVSLGPAFQVDKTVVGLGPLNAEFVFLSQSLTVYSHDYEYFEKNPQRGYKVQLSSLTSNQAIGSSATVSKIMVSFEDLLNAGNFSPPEIVFGTRGLVGTIFDANSSSDVANLPPALLYFLGGTQDLRGFSRQELPDTGLGAMTVTYLGIESRFLSLLPWNLQPYIFGDVGALGVQPTNLDWPIFWDPGVGIRWASPIGAFRGEGAHGFLDSPNSPLNSDRSHWQFYLSYGEEF
jgi:hypothetical protein